MKAGHEAFAQAYASNGGNAADAYRNAYPRCKSAHAAETNGSLLLRNTEVAARISEVLRRGAERAEITVEQVLRELAKIGFSDIRKAVAWRNEMVAREGEEAGKGEDGVVGVTRVLLPRVSVREELEAGAKGVDRPAGGSIQNDSGLSQGRRRTCGAHSVRQSAHALE